MCLLMFTGLISGANLVDDGPQKKQAVAVVGTCKLTYLRCLCIYLDWILDHVELSSTGTSC